MNPQNLQIDWNSDPFDGSFYLTAMMVTISFLSLLFYIGATNKIQAIEDVLNKKNVRIIDLLEKLNDLEEKYNKMDSDHVDDYNMMLKSFQQELNTNTHLRQLLEKLENELTEARALHSELKAQNEEFVKRIGRLESRLTRVTA
jgi:chromosome segregation ATPase